MDGCEKKRGLTVSAKMMNVIGSSASSSTSSGCSSVEEASSLNAQNSPRSQCGSPERCGEVLESPYSVAPVSGGSSKEDCEEEDFELNDERGRGDLPLGAGNSQFCATTIRRTLLADRSNRLEDGKGSTMRCGCCCCRYCCECLKASAASERDKSLGRKEAPMARRRQDERQQQNRRQQRLVSRKKVASVVKLAGSARRYSKEAARLPLPVPPPVVPLYRELALISGEEPSRVERSRSLVELGALWSGGGLERSWREESEKSLFELEDRNVEASKVEGGRLSCEDYCPTKGINCLELERGMSAPVSLRGTRKFLNRLRGRIGVNLGRSARSLARETDGKTFNVSQELRPGIEEAIIRWVPAARSSGEQEQQDIYDTPEACEEVIARASPLSARSLLCVCAEPAKITNFTRKFKAPSHSASSLRTSNYHKSPQVEASCYWDHIEGLPEDRVLARNVIVRARVRENSQKQLSGTILSRQNDSHQAYEPKEESEERPGWRAERKEKAVRWALEVKLPNSSETIQGKETNKNELNSERTYSTTSAIRSKALEGPTNWLGSAEELLRRRIESQEAAQQKGPKGKTNPTEAATRVTFKGVKGSLVTWESNFHTSREGASTSKQEAMGSNQSSEVIARRAQANNNNNDTPAAGNKPPGLLVDTQEKLRSSLKRGGSGAREVVKNGCYEGSISKFHSSVVGRAPKEAGKASGRGAGVHGMHSIKSLSMMTSKLIHSADQHHQYRTGANNDEQHHKLHEQAPSGVTRLLVGRTSEPLKCNQTNGLTSGKLEQLKGGQPGDASKDEKCSSLCKTSEASRRNQDEINNNNTFAGQTGKYCQSSELERRRASIRNGDVFIYPSIYTDLNECHKCFRDKLICNCNNSLTSVSSSSANSSNTSPSSGSSLDLRSSSKELELLGGGGGKLELEISAVEPAPDLMGSFEPQVTRRPKAGEQSSRSKHKGSEEAEAKGLSSLPAPPATRPRTSVLSREARCFRSGESGGEPEGSARRIVFELGESTSGAFDTSDQKRGSSGSLAADECDRRGGSEAECDRGAALDWRASESAAQANSGPDNTSVVAIESASGSRRSLFVGAAKLSRQPAPVSEEDLPARVEQERDKQQVILLPSSLNLERKGSLLELCAVEASTGNDFNCHTDGTTSSGDVFEYSPILSSVRDYINNFNTELQVQTASAAAAALSPSAITIPSESCLAITADKLSYLEMAEEASREQPANSSAQTGNILTVITAPNSAISDSVLVDKAAVFPLSSEARQELGAGLESPKKSIFDGASKDEILEYLADARERVPELLMAADDVMVINENELLVVNQLEPNSPATPISIVDAAEVLQSPPAVAAGSLVCLESSLETNLNLAPDLGLNLVASEANVISKLARDPEQLRQHLRDIYKCSQLTTGSSRFSSGTETIDDESSSQPAGTDSDFARSMSVEATGSSGAQSLFGEAKSLSSVSGGNKSERLEESKVNLSPTKVLGFSNNDQPERLGEPRRRASGKLFQHAASFRRTSNSDWPNKAAARSLRHRKREGLHGYLAGAERKPNGFSLARRKSASASDECRQANERNGTLRMMLLLQRYSNRDSLSSSSSSPPPSTSSSNPTSGNCSAASNFYASSSLSCSSPLLPLLSSQLAGSPCSALNTSNSNNHQLARDPQQGKFVFAREPNSNPELEELASSNLESIHEIASKELPPEGGEAERALGGEGDKQQPRAKVSATQQDKLSIIEEAPNRLDSELRRGAVGEAKAKVGVAKKLPSKSIQGHYSTINRLNNFLLNRHPAGEEAGKLKLEFQCLDCDQFIDVDQARMLTKSKELRLRVEEEEKPLSPGQLEKAYIAAMNGLPLCKACEKKRVERKEIIMEFVETELKYGSDLKIIHEEFYRPMQIAGLLSKEQINGVFLNLEELIMANCRFSNRLTLALEEANLMGDTDYNTINIGRMFVDSAEMLHTYESYCIRQGSAACLLARLAKEKELLRIFLRVSQMENTLLRRMNLAAFLMVPVQRVTRYPLLLNRLYKVTAYHHKDREALRDAQLKVELHLEHINQQTKGVGATNKIWRRFSSLSAPISANRRGLFNAEDIGYIKLRKTAMDMLKWERDDTQFIHSGRMNFTPLNEFMTRQKAKSARYMPAHALLIVLGKPNWKYRPDLVKSSLDSKLMSPTPGGNGIKEAALLLFREKNGRFIPCREPILLSNCVLSLDCSQFDNDCGSSAGQPCHHSSGKASLSAGAGVVAVAAQPGAGAARNSLGSAAGSSPAANPQSHRQSSESNGLESKSNSITDSTTSVQQYLGELSSKSGNGSNGESELKGSTLSGDALSMSSLKSLPEEQASLEGNSPPAHTSRSYSLASALPRSAIPINRSITSQASSGSLAKCSSGANSSGTIFNQLITKVNNYHNKTPERSSGGQSSACVALGGPAGSLQPGADLSPAAGQLQSKMSENKPAGSSKSPPQQASQQASSASNSNNLYNHHHFHNHHQPYGDYEESFEIHDRLSKESLLLRADTPLKTRYWLQMLRYHAKDLGQWRSRRIGLANIMMMMRQE